MTLEEIYFITQISVGIAIIMSILFVALELRPNFPLLRKTMADNSLQRVNWLFETLCTNKDFRDFHRRVDTNYENFTEEEKYRATCLGIRSLRSMLDEQVAYFDGHISKDEWVSLRWNMKFAATRPKLEAAYQFIKNSYPIEIHKFWEPLPKHQSPDGPVWIRRNT